MKGSELVKMKVREVLIISAGMQSNVLHKQVFHLLADYLDGSLNDDMFVRMKRECCTNGVTLHGVLLGHIPILFERIGITKNKCDYELLYQITILNLVVSLMTNQITRTRFDYITKKLERLDLNNAR